MMQITENRIRDFFSQIPNSSENYENGKTIVNYNFYSIKDNNFNISYHLYFPQKNINYNFWFDKISYINSIERISISFNNNNEKFEGDKLKRILQTTDFDLFKTKFKEIIEPLLNIELHKD